MISLTPLEQRLRRVLIRRALSADPVDLSQACISYKDVGQEIDPGHVSHYPMTMPPFRGFNEVLGHVSMYEFEHGRPLLSALVVSEDLGHPGHGFGRMGSHLGFDVKDEYAFWQAQLGRLIGFWSASDPILIADSAMDRVIDELRSIRRLLRRVLERSDES